MLECKQKSPTYFLLSFILPFIIPVRGHGVISTLLIIVRGQGVCSLVYRESLLGLNSELRSDALPATTIDFPGIRTHNSLLRTNGVL